MPNPRMVTAAWLLSVAFAVFSLWSALFEPTALLFAVIFSAITVGIRKRRAWSAYGAAILILSIGCTFLLLTMRNPARPQIPWAGAVFWIGMMLGVAFVFYRAGRKLPEQGSRRTWIAVAAAVFLFPQVLRPITIPTPTMENTILTGDRIFVRPIAGTPNRGDLIVFRYPVDRRQTFLKRVIAIGGDRLRIDNKTVLLNGVPLHEPYVTHTSAYVEPFRDTFPVEPPTRLFLDWVDQLTQHTVAGELVVPPGKFFVLGDNRDVSLDSRYWGFVSPEDIVGKPVLVYFSSDPGSKELTSQPILLHPQHIRWARLFRPL